GARGPRELRRRLTALRREVEAIDLGSLLRQPADDRIGAELLAALASRTEARTALVVEPEALPDSTLETVVVIAAHEEDAGALEALSRALRGRFQHVEEIEAAGRMVVTAHDVRDS